MSIQIKSYTVGCLIALLPILTFAQGCYKDNTATTPTNRFIIIKNGTVSDLKTGLMWKRCAEGQTWSGTTCLGEAKPYGWSEALKRAKTGYMGYTDWRVPNIKELSSIVEKQCKQPAINSILFPVTINGRFWSSSSFVSNPSQGWYVDFERGTTEILDAGNKSIANYVRLVRSGQ